jgi:hypothetical protein
MGVVGEHHRRPPTPRPPPGQALNLVLQAKSGTHRVGGSIDAKARNGNPRAARVAVARASDIPRRWASCTRVIGKGRLADPGVPVITAARSGGSQEFSSDY